MAKKKKRYAQKKADSQRIHCARRAMERYEIFFGPKAQREAVQQIQSGDATHVSTRSNRATVWRVRIQKIDMKVVYDKKRKTIVTVLPREEESNDPVFGGPT